MKAIKVLMIALLTAFAINTVSAQTAPAKPAVKTEKSAAKHAKKGHKKGHKKHTTKKVAPAKK